MSDQFWSTITGRTESAHRASSSPVIAQGIKPARHADTARQYPSLCNFTGSSVVPDAGCVAADVSAGQSSAPARLEVSIILFFMADGPSHIEMYDMKTDQFAEIHGPFAPTRNQPARPECLRPEASSCRHRRQAFGDSINHPRPVGSRRRGGSKDGQIVGSTTSDGGERHDRPLKPADLLATMYKSIDIDRSAAVINPQNRPIPILPEGDPISELI